MPAGVLLWADRRQVLTAVLGVPAQAGADPAELTARMPPARPGRVVGEQAAAALAGLAQAGIRVGTVALGQPSLDEVFLTLTAAQAVS